MGIPLKPAIEVGIDQVKSDSAHSKQLLFNAQILALGGRYDADTDKMTLPDMARFVTVIRNTKGDMAQQIATILTLNSIKEKFSEGTYHLSCTYDLPDMDKITTAYDAQGKFSDTPVNSLKSITSNGVIISTDDNA